MPMFEVEMGGKKYQVEAPDIESAVNGVSGMAPQTVFSGSILPMSRDNQGNVSFDSNAGILGTLKRTATLPGQVYRGEVDPMSDEGIARSLEMGLVTSPVSPSVRSGELLPGMRPKRTAPPKNPPTAEQLKAAGSRGFDQVRDMGVHYRSDSVAGVAQGLRANLERDGILPELAPKAYKILDALENPPAGSTAPLSGLEAARRALRNAGKDFANPTEQLAARRIREGLDSFVQMADPATVVAGPAAAAARLEKDARANYAAGKRSERLSGIGEAANLRAIAANSGQNLDNAIRQRATSVLLDPKKRAGFSKGEIALIERVAKGNVGRNTIRAVGNLLGGGGGLGMAVTGLGGGLVGGTYGGLPGVAVGVGLPVVGVGAKQVANRLTERALNKADEATRRRSPLYRNAPRVPINQAPQSVMGRVALPPMLPPRITDEEYRAYIQRGGA